MPRPKNDKPTYLHHKASGRAYIRVAGNNVYLGPFGSVASTREYERQCAEIKAGRVPGAATTLTVSELVLKFDGWAEGYYRDADGTPTSELDWLRRSLLPVDELYGPTPAAEFGPLALKAVRQKMVEGGLSRKTVNARVNRVRRAFKWAVSEQLVPPAVIEGLRAVAALKAGRTEAKETEPVGPAPEADVAAVLPHLVPTVRAMVEVQYHTGCRPGEVRRMVPADVDRAGEVWVWRPGRHKTLYRGKARVIPLGPKCRAVLAPFLEGKGPDDLVFTPAAAKAERYAALRKTRKSKVQPSQVSRAKPPAKLKKQPAAFYTVSRYAGAIAEGCARAGVPAFAPNQIRHTHGTRVRRLYGLEAAQVALGHAQANVTQVYAERDQSLAEKVAREIG